MIVTKNTPDWVGAKGKCDYCNWEVELEEGDIPTEIYLPRYIIKGLHFTQDELVRHTNFIFDITNETFSTIKPLNVIPNTYGYGKIVDTIAIIYNKYKCPNCKRVCLAKKEFPAQLELTPNGIKSMIFRA